MKTLPLAPRNGLRGFSMIEMVGVLAIVAIIASIITPNLARRISRGNGEKEDATLSVIADALIRHVKANQTIPGSSSWVTNIATQAGLSVNDVRYVNPSDTGNTRVYLIHPSFSPTNSSGTDPLWTQAAAGASSVTNARLLIVSVHKSGLTLPVSSGRASSASAFDAIWDWNYNESTKSPPSGWNATWTGNGEYLHVQRINLSSLFQRATFSNMHHGTNYPYYQIGGAAATSMTSTNVVNAFYVSGTLISLYFTNGTTLQLSHTLRDSVNFIYESSRWRVP